MASDASSPRIVIAGAGSIGCFVGGLLAAAGKDVTLLVRPRVAAEIEAEGLTLTDLEGLKKSVAAEDLNLAQDPDCLKDADIVLVTVKSRDTQSMASLIAQHALGSPRIVSLQNGVTNTQILNDALPQNDVRAGMVPFNVVPLGGGQYHRATDGHIVIQNGPGELGNLLNVAGLRIEESTEIQNIQWGKFLLNLNNALNAISGLPIREQLTDRRWRLLMADQWDEALRVIKASGAQPVSSTPVSVSVIPWVLRLPTFLFTRVASAMLKIDPTARASMSYDIISGRPTEIDVLQGEIVRLGQQLNVPTPLNRAVALVLEEVEEAKSGLPNFDPSAVRSRIDS